MADSDSPKRILDPSRPLRPTGFDAVYADGGTPPWDIGRPQPAFLALADAGLLRGRVLDVGCGTGEHVLMVARIGLDATGVDTASTAITRAERKAADRGLTARFVVRDALDLEGLGERFDTVLDCGFFHVLTDEDRIRFAASLRSVVPAGGRYFMLCFSDRVQGNVGPRRVSRDEITATFEDGWRADSIEPAVIDVTYGSAGIPAWRASLTRT